MPRVEIRPAYPDDFERVLPLLASLAAGALGRSDWRRLFCNPWTNVGPDVGRLLLSDGRVRGFLGAIWSERRRQDRYRLECNMTSWVVEPEYRSQSLGLLSDLLKANPPFVTNWTPSTTVAKILPRFGFRELEQDLELFLPGLRGPAAEVSFDVSGGVDQLGEGVGRILRDHRGFGCVPAFVEHDGRTGALVLRPYVVRRQRFGLRLRLPLMRAHYLAEPQVLFPVINALVLAVCRHFGVAGLVIDRRLWGASAPKASWGLPMESRAFFRSGTEDEAEADTLYSEMVLLHQ